MPHKIPAPSKEWLEQEWLLPPRGKGRGSPDIARELNVDKSVVLRWIKRYGISEPASVRQSAHRTGKATWSKEKPAKDEIARLYLMPPSGNGKSLSELAKHYEVTVTTVRRWIKFYDLTQPFVWRHSQRMSGSGNPAYTNGNAQHYVAKKLAKAKPKICEWCGTGINVQIHHIDHNRQHNENDNLMWLCGACNRLEANIWILYKSNRATFEHVDNQVIITFKEQSK